LVKQLLRSGTSVAAHVREASRARSDAEFISKLGGAIQEADESALWLELLREECSIEPAITKSLEDESSELIAIFTTMINRTRNRSASRIHAVIDRFPLFAFHFSNFQNEANPPN
jgi:four helix bundle protein